MMKKIFAAAALLIASNVASAGPVTCHTNANPDANYCRYTGNVSRLYINESNLILVYYDAQTPEGVAASAGYDSAEHPNGRAAAAYTMGTNLEFGRVLYATLLAAKTQNRTVTLQMRGTIGSHLRIDRVWLN